MIKLNHKNKYIKTYCEKLLNSEDSYIEKISEINNTVRYAVNGYQITTDWTGEIIEVWQLPDCPDPIFKGLV